jgi:hypothetical protein
MLNKYDKTRRTALVCCHTIRNIAFYRAGWRGKTIKNYSNFWIAANGAFFDIAVLEWCKLFMDKKGTTHWSYLIIKKSLFRTKLRSFLNVSEGEFKKKSIQILGYRNKFIAHLDEEKIMILPKLKFLFDSTSFLYDYIKNDPSFSKYIHSMPKSSLSQYKSAYRMAAKEYQIREHIHALSQ